jgi:hypothetical protein
VLLLKPGVLAAIAVLSRCSRRFSSQRSNLRTPQNNKSHPKTPRGYNSIVSQNSRHQTVISNHSISSSPIQPTVEQSSGPRQGRQRWRKAGRKDRAGRASVPGAVASGGGLPLTANQRVGVGLRMRAMCPEMREGVRFASRKSSIRASPHRCFPSGVRDRCCHRPGAGRGRSGAETGTARRAGPGGRFGRAVPGRGPAGGSLGRVADHLTLAGVPAPPERKVTVADAHPPQTGGSRDVKAEVGGDGGAVDTDGGGNLLKRRAVLPEDEGGCGRGLGVRAQRLELGARLAAVA